MRQYLFIPILLILLSTSVLFGQGGPSNYLNNFQYTISWSNEAVVNGDTVVQLTCNLNIPDSSSIAAIMVKVGNYKGDGSVVDYVFPLDPNYGLPNDYSLSITNSVNIVLGNQEPRTYYFTVVLHDSFGKKSDPLYYSSTTNELAW